MYWVLLVIGPVSEHPPDDVADIVGNQQRAVDGGMQRSLGAESRSRPARSEAMMIGL